MTVRATVLRAEIDSDCASIPSGTERLIYEHVSGDSLATYSDSDHASAPLSIEVRSKRKPRSPQSAAHQSAYHAQWRKTEDGRAKLREASRRWAERYPERLKAHRIVANALRCGRLVKGPCDLAGTDCRGRIEAHHDDYNKPLEVRWVCRGHHERLDRERRSGQ